MTGIEQGYALEPSVAVVGTYPAPEGVAAGMARISRDATPIPDLVRAAVEDTTLARKRNENIIFGYGHSSVAEHGVFSVAVQGIPRSLSLELVSHRLASYTQLSYRYVPLDRLPVHYFLPLELREGPAREIATEAMARALGLYERIYRATVAHLLSSGEKKGQEAAARRATEDARYVLPVAQTTQVGMTANARTWGHVICRLLSHDLSEHRALGQRLKEALQPLAPSLFPDKYLRALDYPGSALDALASQLAALGSPDQDRMPVAAPSTAPQARLIHHDPHAERALAATLLFRVGGLDHHQRAALGQSLTAHDVARVIGAGFAGLAAHDTVLREFETVSYTFELTVSEACLHQLVRHRMSTQVVQERAVRLGYTVPPLIEAVGAQPLELYHQAMALLEDAYARLAQTVGAPRAGIILGNGHNRRVLLHLNARELIELSRLRADLHAQWDVRDMVTTMIAAVQEAHPAIAAGAGGRDAFKTSALPIAAGA